MKEKDPNYAIKVEQAIAKKYGEDTVVNPKSQWDDEKEKKYLDELKEVYYAEVLDLYKDLYDFKDITVYDDLRIVIYENYFPYDVKDAYREVKDFEIHEYCEIAMVTNDERMGRTYVVPVPDELSPAGNQLFWWTKFDRMLTTFPSPFTPKLEP